MTPAAKYSSEVTPPPFVTFRQNTEADNDARRSNELLNEAQESIDALADTLDHRFGKDTPGLMTLTELLEQITPLTEWELHKRGICQTIRGAGGMRGLPRAMLEFRYPSQSPICRQLFLRLSSSLPLISRTHRHRPSRVPYAGW